MRESIGLISAAGATPCGVAIALDRQEKASADGRDAPWSAVQFVTRELGLSVVSVATLADLLAYLQAADDAPLRGAEASVRVYRERYGV